ncbi:hypothetical protein FACS189490_07080 [Clostridia bacterium]|nr:hypothetical protein FACS189490_07080 [Clostridia bacterium]
MARKTKSDDMVREDQQSLFTLSEEKVVAPSHGLDVVEMKYLQSHTLTWEELFDGFDRLYAITYSSAIGFVNKLIGKFKYAEIIFGFNEVISYQFQEILAFQQKTIARLKTSANQEELLRRIDDKTLKLRVAHGKLSHEKIYILEAEDGRKRVIMGSANMSYSAFSGNQRENIAFMDGDDAYDWYFACFEGLKENSTDEIQLKMLNITFDDNAIEMLPIAETVRVRRALVVECCFWRIKMSSSERLKMPKLGGNYAAIARP